eukprot:scaffold1202_cov149-Skeletonema_menzelii.AAC.5
MLIALPYSSYQKYNMYVLYVNFANKSTSEEVPPEFQCKPPSARSASYLAASSLARERERASPPSPLRPSLPH